MSKTTKRKHVHREVLEEFVLPTDNQTVACVINCCGNNLHKVMLPTNEEVLVSMPKKFRRNVFVKRGSYVILEPILEGVKVRFEVAVILFSEQVQYVQEHGRWPEAFKLGEAGKAGSKDGKDKGSYSDIYAGLDREDSASGEDDITVRSDPSPSDLFASSK